MRTPLVLSLLTLTLAACVVDAGAPLVPPIVEASLVAENVGSARLAVRWRTNGDDCPALPATATAAVAGFSPTIVDLGGPYRDELTPWGWPSVTSCRDGALFTVQTPANATFPRGNVAGVVSVAGAAVVGIEARDLFVAPVCKVTSPAPAPVDATVTVQCTSSAHRITNAYVSYRNVDAGFVDLRDGRVVSFTVPYDWVRMANAFPGERGPLTLALDTEVAVARCVGAAACNASAKHVVTVPFEIARATVSAR